MENKSFLSGLGNALRDASPTILTIIGAAGFVTSVVLAVKETPKALEAVQADSRKYHDGDPNAATKAEAVVSAWKYYVPAAVTGAAALACIFGANVLNKKQQASIMSAYALANGLYSEYKDKVVELFGEEGNKKVVQAIEAEHVAKDHVIEAEDPNFGSKISMDFGDDDEEEVLFYDMLSQRHFNSTKTKVLQAVYYANRIFGTETGGLSLNELYDLLGISRVDGGDKIGWYVNDDLYWIDFEITKSVLDDGMVCYILSTACMPDTYEHFCA